MKAKDMYKRERQNLMKRVKAWEKKGYQLLIDLPSIPKKITKASIQRLKNIQLKDLVKKGKVVDVESGEIFSPYGFEQEQKLRRAKSKQKKGKDRRQSVADDFYNETGYAYEETIEDTDLISAELDVYAENLDGINEPVLSNLFDMARNKLGDEQLAKELYSRRTAGGYSLAHSLQVAIGAIQRYQEDGRDDRANSEITYVAMQLNDLAGNVPWTAELSEQLARGNYAP